MRLEYGHRLSVSKDSKGCGISLLQCSVSSLKWRDWRNLRKISSLDSRGMNLLPPEYKSGTYPSNHVEEFTFRQQIWKQYVLPNFSKLLPDSTASHPKRQFSTLFRSLLCYKELTYMPIFKRRWRDSRADRSLHIRAHKPNSSAAVRFIVLANSPLLVVRYLFWLWYTADLMMETNSSWTSIYICTHGHCVFLRVWGLHSE
jgi:hypothetical protein